MHSAIHITQVGVIIITSPGTTAKNNQQQPFPSFQQQEKKSSLDNILGKFIQKIDQYMAKTEITLQNHSAAIKGLKTQIGQLARTISERPQGSLSSNTETNPKGQV